ncbi:MAG TPA: alpha/beta fold hydrolase [Ilumatobacteraceae bacterium]|nr:alpha/beta fold hydrolase [Ilumatobacteraceae bacterium]
MPYALANDGTRIHYEVFGRRRAPAVLMIQGLGADKHGWDMQRFILAGQYRVIAFDNRGAGRSDKPFGAYTMQQMTDDAIAVLDAVGVSAAHVVGASMGGLIGQLMAVRYPERVLSLTLACSACRDHPWRRELMEQWMQTALERGMGAMTRQAARWVMAPRSFRRLAPTFGWLGPLAMSRPAHAFASQVRAILAVDDSMADELSKIDVPTLVIVGNQDILTPRGDAEEIAERIPGAELVVISGAAHGFMVEHASTFNTILFDFLRRASKVRSAPASA